MFRPRATSAGKAVRQTPAATQDAQAHDAIETIRDRNRPTNCVRQARHRANQAGRREVECECRNAAKVRTSIRRIRLSRLLPATPAGRFGFLLSSLLGEVLLLYSPPFSVRQLFYCKPSSRRESVFGGLRIYLSFA